MTSAVLSSGFALLGVLLGAWLTAWSGDRQWTRQTQLRACLRLMDEFALLYDGLAPARRVETSDRTWASWNQALTEVSFVCAAPVVEAAYALDETLWRTEAAVRTGRSGLDDWLRLRRPVEDARAVLVHVVRRQANNRYRGTVRTLGRPPEGDPMWEDWRN